VHGGKQAENNGLARFRGTFVPGAAIAAWAPVANAGVSCADLCDQGGTGGDCTANDPLLVPVEVDDAVWSIPPVASTTLDGVLEDWGNTLYKAQTPFRPCDKVDTDGDGLNDAWTAPFVEFDVCLACAGGAAWPGVTDYSIATTFGWTPGALYCGINVFDDTHQNSDSGWNGDTVQIMFTNAAREQGGTALTALTALTELDIPRGMILYNYGIARPTRA
jgi:hypothetical protein